MMAIIVKKAIHERSGVSEKSFCSTLARIWNGKGKGWASTVRIFIFWQTIPKFGLEKEKPREYNQLNVVAVTGHRIFYQSKPESVFFTVDHKRSQNLKFCSLTLFSNDWLKPTHLDYRSTQNTFITLCEAINNILASKIQIGEVVQAK